MVEKTNKQTNKKKQKKKKNPHYVKYTGDLHMCQYRASFFFFLLKLIVSMMKHVAGNRICVMQHINPTKRKEEE